jgi:hypothetical protein
MRSLSFGIPYWSCQHVPKNVKITLFWDVKPCNLIVAEVSAKPATFHLREGVERLS